MTTAQTPLPLLPFKDEMVSRGFGLLEVKRNDKPVQLPLQRVDLRARVVDRFAVGTMTETFRNTFDEHLEATYVFPLPGGGVVHDFEMHVAGRVVRGVVEERAEARRQYAQAMLEGKRAAILEKERDDVFTVQVGNIPANEEVKIVISWSERLPYFDNGTTELRLPLVVAPRYIPGTPTDRGAVGTGTEADTDLVPDASRITPPRLADGFDPKTGLSIEVELNDGNLADLGCSQHATRLKLDGGKVTVSLAREDERLNRDFILRWRVATDKIETRLWVTHVGEQAYGALSIVPPKREGFLGMPRDVVFVLDRSGSMEGSKMVSASRACAMLMVTLGPRDRYAVQIFDDHVDWLDPSSGKATPACARPFAMADEAGIEKGEKFLRTVTARGGTEIDHALGEALRAIDGRDEGAGRSPIIVLLTDGQIGDEGRVLKRIQREVGDNRVFTVGIDTAVNEGFLKRLATLAGGTSTFVTPGDHLEDALRSVGREIGAPLVTDVKVTGDCIVADGTVPAHIPDLFAGRASVAYLQLKSVGEVRVWGRHADGNPLEIAVTPEVVEMPAISQLWARGRVLELEDRYRVEPAHQAELKSQIIAISKAHRILTRFTAFVTVDDEVVNADGKRRKVTHLVEMPAEWEMGARGGAMPPMPMAAPSVRASMHGPFAPRGSTYSAPPPKKRARLGEAIDAASAPDNATSMDMHEYPSTPAYRRSARNVSRYERDEFDDGDAELQEMLTYIPVRESSFRLEDLREASTGVPVVDDIDFLPEIAESVEISPDHEALWKALDELSKAIEAALVNLKAGKRPSATTLDKARKAVAKALAALDDADRLTLLQRFMRTAALELVAALAATDVEVASLVPLFEGHVKALETAEAETRRVVGGPPQAFWESSI